MARRVSTGITGRTILGDLFTQNDIIRPVLENTTMRLAGTGSGSVEIAETPLIINNGYLGLASTNSSGFVNLKYNGTASFDTVLPTSAGAANQVLSVLANDGTNIELEYKAVTLERADDSTTDTEFGVPFITLSSTDITTLKTRNTFTFNPFTETFSTTNLVESSSIVYKENVNPINNALDMVLRLQGVTFDRKSTKKKEAGLIAEQVEKVLPLVVAYKDNKPDGINYTKIIAYLIESIKSLKTEIDYLKGKINNG